MTIHQKTIAKSLLLCTFLTAGAQATSSTALSDERIDGELTRMLTPAPSSFVADVAADTFEGMRLNIENKWEAAKFIAGSAMKSDWSPLASEAIHLTLCHLTGRTEVALFGAQHEEFDDVALDQGTMKLVKYVQDNLMRLINRDKDHYGIVRGTEQIVDIYRNRTFLQMIVDHLLPKEMPLRGVAMALANNSHIETAVNAYMRTLALDAVKTLAQNRGMSVREISGKMVMGTLIPGTSSDALMHKATPVCAQPTPVASSSSAPQAMDDAELEGFTLLATPSSPVVASSSMAQERTAINAEECTTAKSFMELVAPYLRHQMRNIVEELLKKSLKTAAYQMDKKLRVGAIHAARAMGAGMTYTAGHALTSLGSNIPVVGSLVEALGMGMTSTLGTLAGGVAGGFVGDAAVVSMASNAAKRMDNVTRHISNQIIDYTREEHVLFALNPNASALERALFESDYALRDTLQNNYIHTSIDLVRMLVTGNMGDLLAQAQSAVTQTALAPFHALCALFKSNGTLDAGFAAEHSGLAPYINTEEQERRMRREAAFRHFATAQYAQLSGGDNLLDNLKKYPSYDIRMGNNAHATHSQSAEIYRARNIAQGLEQLSWDLASNFGTHKDYMANCDRMLHMLLTLSPMEQDLLLEMKEDNGFNTIYMNLCEALINCATVEESKEHIKRVVKDYAAEKHAQYLKENEGELSLLRSRSIAEGLTDADLVELHKKLSGNTDARKSLMAPIDEDIVPQDPFNILMTYYEDTVAAQKGHILGQYYAEQMRATNQAQALKADAKRIMKEKASELTHENALETIKGTGDSFQRDIMNLVRPIRDAHMPKGQLPQSAFQRERLSFLSTLAKEVVSELSKEQTSSQGSIMDYIPFPSSSSKQESVPTTQPDAQALEKALRPQRLNIYDASLAGHYKLTKAINAQESFQGKDLLSLNKDDLALLTMAIMDQKANDLGGEDKVFYDTYRREVFAHLSSGQSAVKNLLWFSLEHVITEMREENARLLEKVFAH